MRFATLAFATGAVAQLTTLQPIITKIVGDVGTLDSAINAYTSGDASSVLNAGKALLDDINSGVTTAKGSADLSQNDALSLTTPIQGLQTATEGVIKDLTAKKCALVAAGKGPDVLQNINDQLTASKALADAITSKVPQALQSVAAQLSSGIATALQGGVDSFKDTSSCPAAPGGGSSSSAAPTSGPSSSASAAPTSASGIFHIPYIYEFTTDN
jgi:Hydrophobic surface binding protein A